MDLRINWSHKRSKHMIERMWLRGISAEEVKEALLKGQKRRQKETGLMEALHRFYSVVYAEVLYKESNIRKIFPVTVKIW